MGENKENFSKADFRSIDGKSFPLPEFLPSNGKLNLPPDAKILLHACCAPCSGAIVEILLKNGIRPSIFYSNSNIAPYGEYKIRKNEVLRLAREEGLDVIEDSYDHSLWLEEVAKGYENEPERGHRCLRCFTFRLEKAALYARDNGFNILSTTLASSRWKNLRQVDEAGKKACEPYAELRWWNMNWRKGGLQERRGALIKEREYYNQTYCGCEFSAERNGQRAGKPLPLSRGENQ